MIRALLDHLWQSTLFCAAIWSITLALRANPAAVRHWLWLLASVKFLVPFSALYLARRRGWARDPRRDPANFLRRGDAGRVADDFARAHAERCAAAAPSLLLPALLCLCGSSARCVSSRGAGCAAGAPRSCCPGQRGRRRAHRRMRASRMRTSNRPWRAFFIRWCCCRPRCSGGLIRSQLDAVLAHEREHIARRDNLKAHLHRLVETLFWFHPAGVVDRPAAARRTRARLRRGGAGARPRSGRICGRHPRGVPALSPPMHSQHAVGRAGRAI